MTLHVAVLGSGSLGNCTLVTWHDGAQNRSILIDAGFSPRRTRQMLECFDRTLDDIDGMLITHFDGDHFHAGWPRALQRGPIPVWMHHSHRARPASMGLSGHCIRMFDQGNDIVLPGATVDVVHFAHDRLGTIGYIVACGGVRFGLATDLGRVPRALLDRFKGLDGLAIESNYDPGMQRASDRPDFLKRRIMGGSGHLSNTESCAAVEHIARQSRLQHIAALHLSRECNAPALVRKMYADQRLGLDRILTITSQFDPTNLLTIDSTPEAPYVHVDVTPCSGEQLGLFARPRER